MAPRLMNVNVQNTTATDGSRIFAGVHIHGDFVAGEASLRDRVLKWLSPIDPYPTQEGLRTQRTPRTGETFLNERFQQWLESGSRRLWLYGEGGSGKTFLSSLLVDHASRLLSNPADNQGCKHIVTYFYCSFQESATQEAINFLKSVNAQIFVRHADFKQLKDLYERSGQTVPSQTELCAILAAIAKSPDTEEVDQGVHEVERRTNHSSSTITIILDGLDEVPTGRLQNQYFSVFDALAKLEASQLRIIVVSRFQNIIKHRLTGALGWECMSRTSEDVETDIDLFNQEQISEHHVLNALDSRIKTAIRKRLGQDRPGMFRLAALQMQELCINTQHYDTSDEVEEDKIYFFLDQLPQELDPFYDRIIRNIPGAVRKHLEAALQWITFASRPLFVEEVIAACAIKKNRDGFPSSIGTQTSLLDVKTILEHLRGMVELRPSPTGPLSKLLPRTYTFQLVHQTVSEYLLPVSDIDRPAEPGGVRFEATNAHTYLAQCCLLYLSHCAPHRQGRTSKFPLRSYAWHSWAMHFISSTDADSTKARPTLASVRLHNIMIQPTLYGMDGALEQATSEMESRFEESIHFLSPIQQAGLREAIRDASFPGNIPEEDWSWDTVWSMTGDNPRFFRLVILHPSVQSESEIECSLLNDSLDNCPQYEALTWVWGRDDNGESIHVNGCRFEIRPALLRCLHALRSETKRRVFWIDSVTINMFNFVERGQQVDMMADIYGNASMNVIYVGESDPDIDIAIKEMLACPSLQTASLSYDTLRKREHIAHGLAKLLDRPIWRRLWIVQEIAVAKKVMCYCGKNAISWDDFSRALSQYMDFVAHDPRLPGYLPWGSSLESRQVFRTITSIRQKYQAHNQLRLPELLGMTNSHLVSVPSDNIYALRNLLDPEERNHPLLSVDYSLPVWEAYARLATYIITEYQNIDILSYSTFTPEALRGSWKHLPSWAPINFEPAVLCPGIFKPEQPRIYSAGGRLPGRFSISGDHKCLSVEGNSVDWINSIIPLRGFEFPRNACATTAFWEGVFERNDTNIRDIHGYSQASGSVGEMCWRTVCADRCIDGKRKVKRIPAQIEEDALDDCLLWQQQDLTDRVMVVTASGKLGLAPWKAEIGDQIVVLFGAMVPFVTRGADLDEIDIDNRVLIGECYVHGIMDGEMSRARETGLHLSQMFRFV